MSIHKNEIDISMLQNFAGPRIIIAQRPKITDHQAWFRAIAAIYRAGCLIIYEIDDHPELISKINGRNEVELLIKSVCAIQTSTKELKNYFIDINHNTEYFGNSCHNLPIFTKKHSKKSRIFYGALNRGDYSAHYARIVSESIRKHDSEVYVVADKRFFDSLGKVNKKYYEALNYSEYLSVMRDCDILLSPLDDRPGEKFKSDIKYVEASSLGLVTLASRLVYGETIEDGVTGVIADSEKGWSESLDWLLSNPAERQRIAWNAWNYVRRERLFTEQAPLRIQWYLDLWQRRHELWKEVFDRVPELQGYVER